MLRTSYRTYPRAWQQLLALPQVVLLCYCRPGTLCHRHLLADVLGTLGAEIHGEVPS